jgi:hypothetical protein
MNLNKIVGTAAIIVLSIAVWITLSGQPIAQKINSWQANMMGDNKYFPTLTILLLAIPPLLLLLPVKAYLLKKKKKH